MKKVAFVLVLVLSFASKAQDAEPSNIHTIKLGYGWSTYQEIPTGFSEPDGPNYTAGEISRTGVFALSWTSKKPYSDYEFGLTVGYEQSSGPIRFDGNPFGSYSVDHFLILGQMHFDYWTNDQWKLGANFFLGGGWDAAHFSEGLEQFTYTQVDYHYQIDAFTVSYGERVGIEFCAGYGALGYLRGGFFHRF